MSWAEERTTPNPVSAKAGPCQLRKRVRQAEADSGARLQRLASQEREEVRRQRSARAMADERLLLKIRELHAANYYAYGSRRMWKALGRAGEAVGRGRVERLMGAHGVQGAKRRRTPWRTTTRQTRPPTDGDMPEGNAKRTTRRRVAFGWTTRSDPLGAAAP